MFASPWTKEGHQLGCFVKLTINGGAPDATLFGTSVCMLVEFQCRESWRTETTSVRPARSISPSRTPVKVTIDRINDLVAE